MDKEFPEYWKEAIVKPLHKKGAKNDLKNYRPVSLLCVSGMILEAVIKEQIQDYLEQTGKLGIFQFGYRKHKSTSTAVNTMICKAKNDMNSGSLTAALMFDMSAAFDTVEKDTVLNKLKLLGVSEETIKWINSYLSGRKQRVKIDDEESPTEDLSLGTPQGSRLSPLLFNILTCDLNLYMTDGLCCNFADDTSLSVEAKTKSEMIQKLEKEAEGMTQFTSTNNLVLNPGKTAFICENLEETVKIGNSGSHMAGGNQKNKGRKRVIEANSWTQTDLEVKNPKKASETGSGEERIREQGKSTTESWSQLNTVEASKSTELLGMKIQGDLKWDSHILDLKKTLRKRIGVLTRLRHLVPKQSLKMAADAIFTSKLRYGIATYLRPKLKIEDESNKTLKELTVLQNEMLRVITGKKLSDHETIESLRRNTKTMSVNQICIYHIMLETYGIVNLKSSPVLENMIKKSPNEKIETLRNAKMLQIPVNQGRNNAFNFYAASAWNQFQKWLIDENNKQTPRRQQSLREECVLRSGLGLKCCCHNNFCRNVARTRPMTEKEIMLKQRKVEVRALKQFKKQLKKWILREIPQD